MTVIFLVRMKGLEPSRLTALVPKTSVSTNSTTSAQNTSAYSIRINRYIQSVIVSYKR